jgi:acyl carrier protein
MPLIREIEEKVQSYIVTSFLSAEQAEAFDAHTDLLTVLDSLQLLRTVVQLEVLFGVKVEDEELTAENLGSVHRIAALVGRKWQGSTACGGARG